jgi:hypothetical protein
MRKATELWSNKLDRSGECGRVGCNEPAEWTPVFLFLPHDETDIVHPARVEMQLVVCERHRAKLLEEDVPEMTRRLGEVMRDAGLSIDDEKTVVEMVSIAGRA